MYKYIYIYVYVSIYIYIQHFSKVRPPLNPLYKTTVVLTVESVQQ